MQGSTMRILAILGLCFAVVSVSAQPIWDNSKPTAYWTENSKSCDPVSLDNIDPPVNAEILVTVNVIGVRTFPCDGNGKVTSNQSQIATVASSTLDGSWGWQGRQDFNSSGISFWQLENPSSGQAFNFSTNLQNHYIGYNVNQTVTPGALTWKRQFIDSFQANYNAPGKPVYFDRVDTTGSVTNETCAPGANSTDVPYRSVTRVYYCPDGAAPSAAVGQFAAHAVVFMVGLVVCLV